MPAVMPRQENDSEGVLKEDSEGVLEEDNSWLGEFLLRHHVRNARCCTHTKHAFCHVLTNPQGRRIPMKSLLGKGDDASTIHSTVILSPKFKPLL